MSKALGDGVQVWVNPGGAPLRPRDLGGHLG